MENKPESIVISWCDNGFTDSVFTSSINSLLLYITNYHRDIDRVGINQIIGNQIAKQRGEALLNFEQMECDWILFVDSDIAISPQAFDLLWNNRHIKERPVMCGIYFITFEPNSTLPAPIPCIFKIQNEEGSLPIHPLPENQIIPIDVAGLGFALIHKSVIEKLRDNYGNTTFQITIGDKHISEDVSFFYKLKNLNIPVYAHTGAIVPHIKRFMFDANYYNLWWDTVAPLREEHEKRLKESQNKN